MATAKRVGRPPKNPNAIKEEPQTPTKRPAIESLFSPEKVTKFTPKKDEREEATGEDYDKVNSLFDGKDDYDKRKEFDDQIIVKIIFINRSVKLLRQLCLYLEDYVSIHDVKSGVLPAVPKGNLVYSLKTIENLVFAEPWNAPTTEKERFEAISNYLLDKEKAHVRDLSFASKTLTQLTGN